MMRVALNGAGRMSEAIVQAAKREANIEICAVVAPRPPQWQMSLSYFTALEQLELPLDVLVDFSQADGTVAAADWCLQSGVALLSGVTALHQKALDGLALAACEVPVLWSANLSIGANVLASLCAQTAASLGPETSVVIQDIHHQWKKDAPSGTALMLGEAIERKRRVGASRVEYVSVREGESIGRHEVTFRMAGEQITLGHEAQDRKIFAEGAISAALWLGRQAPGSYTSTDWISCISSPED